MTARLAAPFEPVPGGVRVLVRATPKSARSAVTGLMARPDGRGELKVALRAAPEAGRANDELIGLLAKAWNLPRRDLTLAAGVSARRKVVLVAGDSGAILSRLEGWLGGLAGPSRR